MEKSPPRGQAWAGARQGPSELNGAVGGRPQAQQDRAVHRLEVGPAAAGQGRCAGFLNGVQARPLATRLWGEGTLQPSQQGHEGPCGLPGSLPRGAVGRGRRLGVEAQRQVGLTSQADLQSPPALPAGAASTSSRGDPACHHQPAKAMCSLHAAGRGPWAPPVAPPSTWVPWTPAGPELPHRPAPPRQGPGLPQGQGLCHPSVLGWAWPGPVRDPKCGPDGGLGALHWVAGAPGLGHIVLEGAAPSERGHQRVGGWRSE